MANQSDAAGNTPVASAEATSALTVIPSSDVLLPVIDAAENNFLLKNKCNTKLKNAKGQNIFDIIICSGRSHDNKIYLIKCFLENNLFTADSSILHTIIESPNSVEDS